MTADSPRRSPVITEDDLEALDTQGVLDEAPEATDRINGIFMQIGSIISVVAMIVIGSLMLLAVVLRYVFSASLPLAAEAPTYFFPWLIAGGAIVAQARLGHVSVDLVLELVRPTFRKGLMVLVWVVTTGILAYAAYLAIFLTQSIYGQSTVIMGWPRVGSFGAFAGMLIILAVQALVRVIHILKMPTGHLGSNGGTASNV